MLCFAKLAPLSIAVCMTICVIACTPFETLAQRSRETKPAQQISSPKKTAVKLSNFDGQAAFGYLKDVCKLGPRVSGSRGMNNQQKYLEKHFKELGVKAEFLKFRAKSPLNGRKTTLQNILVQFHPDRKRRLLICCHYDTRPFPDQDKFRPRGKFIGANDGGSGVALLCELGKHVKDMPGPFGIDFVFFDGEEFVLNRTQEMFLGSTDFAKKYAAGKFSWKYEYGILVDMVGDKDLQIYMEGNSLSKDEGLSTSIWGVAADLKIKEFIPKQRHMIRDDHLPLNDIAKIRTCDIIDFDYPNPRRGNIYWHTTSDSIQNCSAESLGKVGAVVLEWLRRMQKLHTKK